MSELLKKALQSYHEGEFAQALGQFHRVMTAEKLRTQEIYALLGNTHLKMGRPLEAGDAFAEGASLPGPNAPMLAKFAMELFVRTGAERRIAAFGRRALELHPEDRALAFDYARALFAEGRYDDAAALVPRLDRADPDHLALIVNTLRLTGQFTLLALELEDRHRRAPDDLLVTVSRFVVAREIADFAVCAEEDRLMLHEDDPEARAVREASPAIAKLLWSRSDRTNALPSAESIRLAALPSAATRRAIAPEGARLKIGYLSADFQDHATMRLFEDVLALHDRTKFEVTLFCYTDPHRRSWQGRNLPPEVLARLVFVGDRDDRQAAEEISARGIDILVDLKGHTMNARLGIARLSDAPLKVTYLGYPASVVGGGFDYALTDPVVTPDEAVPFFEENLCRLPETYQANGSLRRPLPAPLERSDVGLPEGRFVFASFNAIQKIGVDCLALWARVLKAVPESLFWVLAGRVETRANLLGAFEAQGVSRGRIVFAESTGYADHVARLGLADLGLDTFPYNGHTTTSDMLWAGLPVLTLKGRAFQARVSESLLGAAGIEGLVAADEDDFCARAANLAARPQAIAALKAKLEENRFRAPLFDSARFTAHLEEAYRLMAKRARRGLPPALIDVPALPPRAEAFSTRRRG